MDSEDRWRDLAVYVPGAEHTAKCTDQYSAPPESDMPLRKWQRIALLCESYAREVEALEARFVREVKAVIGG